MKLRFAASVEDYREQARRRIPSFLFHYVDGAAGTEATAGRNRLDMDNVLLTQRVMVDVHAISTSIEIFGQTLSMPVVLGPVGMAGLFARRGEVQAQKAALAANIPFCLSTLSVCALDEVSRAGHGRPWFQLYMLKDRAFMKDLLGAARAAGAPALVFTVDVPVGGIRRRDRRFGASDGLGALARQVIARPGWLSNVAVRGRPLTFGNVAPLLPRGLSIRDFGQWIAANLDPTVTWDDAAFIRQHWDGPLLIKGVMTPSDAEMAISAGADGIVVSNHGGRQLDGVRSTISALPPIVASVGGRAPVLLDGGVHSGIDVVRALALGAHACLLGRAWAFALAAGGEKGVAQLLADMHREIVNTLALTGCRDVRDAGRSLLDSPSMKAAGALA